MPDHYNLNLDGLAGTTFRPFEVDPQLKNFNNSLTSNSLNNDSFLGRLDSFLGENQNTLNTLGDIGNLASGLAGTFAGIKQMGLAEDAFDFNKAMKEREFAMAKDAYDRNVRRAESIGNQMRAGSVGG